MSHPFATTIPADLKAQIDKHMELFRGFVMVDEGGSGGDAGADGKAAEQGTDTGKDAKSGTGKDQKGKDGDEPLGPAGLKALQDERDARKALEKKVAELDGTKATLEALKAALGPEAADKDDPAAAVKAVTDEVGALKRELLVERVAREHKITSADDIKLLAGLSDEEQIRSWAKRLAPADGEGAGEGSKEKNWRGQPKPDPSAGRGGGGDAKPTGVSAGRDLFKDTHKPQTT